MKNLPQSISIFKINEKKQTIRYEEMYREEIRWEKEDIFKCLILIFPILSLLLFALGAQFHIFILRCLAYILLGFSFLAIVALVIAETIIQDKLWAKQVAETQTAEYKCLKTIYQMSRTDLWFKLHAIREKENTTIAEREFYEEYKELYDHEYVEFLAIPLWYAPSD